MPRLHCPRLRRAQCRLARRPPSCSRPAWPGLGRREGPFPCTGLRRLTTPSGPPELVRRPCRLRPRRAEGRPLAAQPRGTPLNRVRPSALGLRATAVRRGPKAALGRRDATCRGFTGRDGEGRGPPAGATREERQRDRPSARSRRRRPFVLVLGVIALVIVLVVPPLLALCQIVSSASTESPPGAEHARRLWAPWDGGAHVGSGARGEEGTGASMAAGSASIPWLDEGWRTAGCAAAPDRGRLYSAFDAPPFSTAFWTRQAR